MLTKHKKTELKSLNLSSQCSGPNFTNKSWKKVFSANSSAKETSIPIGNIVNSNAVYISSVESNPQNIMTYQREGSTQYIYSSTDKGNTFNKVDVSKFTNYYAVGFKAFNDFQLISDSSNQLYLSTDGFDTIKKSYNLKSLEFAPPSFNILEMPYTGSDDGSYIYVPVYYNINQGGFLKLSIDTSFNLSGRFIDFKNYAIGAIKCSDDGKTVCSVVGNYNNNTVSYSIWISNDYGETWKSSYNFSTSISTESLVISMNNDGNIIMVSFFANQAPYLIASYDNGNNWTFKPSTWLSSTSLSMSSDGWTIMGVSSNGTNNIFSFISRDMANSWGTTPPSNFDLSYGVDIFMSYDYSKMYVLTGTSLWSLN